MGDIMDDKSTNEKIEIYIIFSLIIIIIVVLILHFLGVFNRKIPEANIVVNDNAMFKYSKKKWDLVKTDDYSSYNWNKYKIYSMNKYMGKKQVVYMTDNWYVFENDRTPVDVSGDKLYLGGKININHYNFEKLNFDEFDYKYFHSVLDKYNIDRDEQNDYSFGYKVKFDFDSDKKDEVLYVISNMFIGKETSKLYSFVFIKDGKNTNMLYNSVFPMKDNPDGCYNYLYSIIKVDSTSNYQLITRCSHYSVSNDDIYRLYQYKNNRVELLISNK